MSPFRQYQVIAGLIVSATLTGAAQTNAPQPELHWLVMTAPHLRGESIASVQLNSSRGEEGLDASQNQSPTADFKSQPPGSFSLSSSREDTEFYLRNRDFQLIPPPKAMSSDPITHGFDSVFRPEEFHIGRTATLSCSIATAIKRRNPLCLLNPTFLHVSW
jgi:hypothetical protein